MANGAFSIYKIFIGAGVSATLGLLTFMGNGIVSNDKTNTKEHTNIRREAVEAIDEVKDIATEIRIEQSEQRIMLKGIAQKL